MNEIKFEVGKCYRNRAGRCRIVLTTTRPQPYPPIIAMDKNTGDCCSLNIDGTWSKGHKDDRDLISEWIDAPEVDWSKMPAWAEAVTVDGSGSWNWFTHIPITTDVQNFWICKSGGYGPIPPEYSPKWTGDWRQSLVVRPKTGS